MWNRFSAGFISLKLSWSSFIASKPQITGVMSYHKIPVTCIPVVLDKNLKQDFTCNMGTDGLSSDYYGMIDITVLVSRQNPN